MSDIRKSSEGNTRLLKQYGGGSSPPRQHYATGGAVSGAKDGPALSEGIAASGNPAKASLARPGRKMSSAKKGDKGKTNVNIVIAQAPKDAGPGGPPPMPPGPPPGPPMMRASGGRVAKDSGGSISEDSKKEAAKLRGEAAGLRKDAMTDGTNAAGSGIVGSVLRSFNRHPVSKLGKALEYGNYAYAADGAVSAAKKMTKASSATAEADRIEQGKVKPGEEDRKSGGRVCRADGGPALKGFDAGAGGGKARLEKIKKYGE